jgi:hypothetical protein
MRWCALLLLHLWLPMTQVCLAGNTAPEGLQTAQNPASSTGNAPLAGDYHWESIGQGVFGNMFGCAIHPQGPKIIIAGVNMGCAFRSCDGGKSWKSIGRIDVPNAQPAYRGHWCTAFDPTKRWYWMRAFPKTRSPFMRPPRKASSRRLMAARRGWISQDRWQANTCPKCFGTESDPNSSLPLSVATQTRTFPASIAATTEPRRGESWLRTSSVLFNRFRSAKQSLTSSSQPPDSQATIDTGRTTYSPYAPVRTPENTGPNSTTAGRSSRRYIP